jgi:hypothetical protein
MADTNAFYRVQVSEHSTFASIGVDLLATTGELSVPSAALKIGKTYFWRVRKWSSDGSDWSAVRRFVVTEPTHIENDAMINPEAPR